MCIRDRKRGDGVNDVPLAGILHIHHRDPPGSEVIARRQRGAVSLVGGDHMVPGIGAVGVHQIIAQRLELGIRHAGVKIRAQDAAEGLNLQDVYKRQGWRCPSG